MAKKLIRTNGEAIDCLRKKTNQQVDIKCCRNL
jgi:hypothetical protein